MSELNIISSTFYRTCSFVLQGKFPIHDVFFISNAPDMTSICDKWVGNWTLWFILL